MSRTAYFLSWAIYAAMLVALVLLIIVHRDGGISDSVLTVASSILSLLLTLSVIVFVTATSKRGNSERYLEMRERLVGNDGRRR